jgi:hypothetical protein
MVRLIALGYVATSVGLVERSVMVGYVKLMKDGKEALQVTV